MNTRGLKGLENNITEVIHVRPHAYCVAKPTMASAVLVSPPRDSLDGTILIQNDSALLAQVGGWYTVAYCKHRGEDSGSDNFILLHQPEVKEWSRR